MTEHRFTPGPWEIVKDSDNHWGMREVKGPRPGVRGFTVATDVSFDDAIQTDADIELIAAAPDLIDALEALLEDTQHAEHDCGDPDCPVRKARAALEKAGVR